MTEIAGMAQTHMFALVAGLAAGLVHVLSGPDHLAAVAPSWPTTAIRTGGPGSSGGSATRLA